jgi:hypothetical protein
LYHIDIEICKGAGLQIILFRNRILDQSMQLSDRYAELHKHIVRILRRPDLARQTRKIEREYGLGQFYSKGRRRVEAKRSQDVKQVNSMSLFRAHASTFLSNNLY